MTSPDAVPRRMDAPAPEDWPARCAGLPVLQQVALSLAHAPEALSRMGRMVLAHPFRAATLSIEEFAREVGVSVATANRFARVLGFAGYPQFRAQLARGLESVLAPVESLRTSLQQPASSPEAMLAALQESRTNLECTAQALQEGAAEQAVELLAGAEQVFTLGFGSSAYLAGLLQHELEPYAQRVTCLAQAGGPTHAARQLVKCGAKDVLIALAFPRYVQDTIELARLAREQGMKVLALTDAMTSPLVPLADVVLMAQVRRQAASTSNATVLALCEALVAAVARRTAEAVERVEAVTRAVLPWLQVVDARRSARTISDIE
jgi:DNA-binding MurR/RpiR family transcriptional regulator